MVRSSMFSLLSALKYDRFLRHLSCQITLNLSLLCKSSTRCLMNQRQGSLNQRLQRGSPTKTRRTSPSTSFLKVLQMPRKNSGTESYMLTCSNPITNTQEHRETQRSREKQKEGVMQGQGHRTASRPLRPHTSAIAARRQLLLM